jgi:hypothetical protein
MRRSFIRHARRPGVGKRWPEIHATDPGLSRGCFAQAAWPRCRVKNSARKACPAQAALRIADGFAFGVSRGIPILHHAAGAFTREPAAKHKHGTIWLVPRRLGKALHRRGSFVPPAFGAAGGWLPGKRTAACEQQGSGTGNGRATRAADRVT